MGNEMAMLVSVQMEGPPEAIAEALMTLAGGISKTDQALLDALNERASRIARKLERLDARTKQ